MLPIQKDLQAVTYPEVYLLWCSPVLTTSIFFGGGGAQSSIEGELEEIDATICMSTITPFVYPFGQASSCSTFCQNMLIQQNLIQIAAFSYCFSGPC